MIRGYAEQPSPRAGGRVTLRVSTDAARFRVQFHRAGARLVPVGGTDWFRGEDVPLHLPFQDWGEVGRGLAGERLAPWPRYEVPVPLDWRPGVYLAALVEGDAVGNELFPPLAPLDARDGCALFVVRPGPRRRTARALYKVPLFTYHAYNLVHPRTYDSARRQGHWSLYNMPRPDEVPIPFPEAVSVHRPGGGIGGAPYDTFNADPLDPSPRQTFGHWDARMVAWLEREGYRLDYCTDFDLHEDGRRLLAPYRLLVSSGHDEYWSDRMRDAVEGFTADGGNVAFFAGNVAWWRIVFRSPVSFSREQFWHEVPGRPENQLSGVSFRNGGERDRDEHPLPVGYRVQRSSHWAYDGTGLRDGDVFGGRPEEYLVGFECDGAEFSRSDLEAGRPVVPTGTDGTPADFTILGVGDTRPSGWGNGNCAATMGLFTRGGTVFTAGTTDWPRVLTAGTSPAVEQITRNVMDRLAG